MKHLAKIASFIFIPAAFISGTKLHAQSVNVPLNKDYHHLVERYEIKKGTFVGGADLAVKPFQRKLVAQLADEWRLGKDTLNNSEKFDLEYLSLDNWEWSENQDSDSEKPIFRSFYKKKTDFLYYQSGDFQIHVDPIIHFAYGEENESDLQNFVNTRGVEVRGMISKSIGFYSYLGENQARFPTYVNEYIFRDFIVPGEGFWKDFKDDTGVDFLTGRAYITFDPIKVMNVQFGIDRNFFGNGYRSLLLSDFSSNYLFLKVNTRISERFNYTNLFTELRANALGSRGGSIDGEYPKKYMTIHRLGFNVNKKLNIGLFEQIIFGDPDENNPPAIKAAYFNPIILSRSIMRTSKVAENVALGLDAKWFALPSVSLYGQLYIDNVEFDKLNEGWWSNKMAFQLGSKYIDAFGINMLDLQAEVNVVRPYTYTGENNTISMTHYRQPLAHPMGANFQELIGIVRYRPIPRLFLTGKAILAEYGIDRPNENWGQSLLKSSNMRMTDSDNFIGQGIKTQSTFIDFTASYMIKHNLFIDIKQIFRTLSTEELLGRKENTRFSQLVLRWNIPQREHEF
jgi:hypothetical protein